MRPRGAALLVTAIAVAFAWSLLRAESQGAIAALKPNTPSKSPMPKLISL